MQADCDDLRVTDASGKLLEHWITGNATHTCNTATTYVYVKLPALPASGSILYFYYGSPSAVDAEVTLGKNTTPGLSCQDILDHGNSTGSGLYYIAPSGNDTSQVEAYCDMTTSGGGWTLIISQQNNIILTDYYATPPRLTNDGAISYYINNDLKNVSESIWVTNHSDQTHTFTTADFTGPLITNATSFADAADLSTNGLLAGNNSPVVTHFQIGQVCSVAGCHVAASSSTSYCNPVAQIWDWNAPDAGATANDNAHFGCKSNLETTWAKRGKWLFVKGLHNFSSNTTATLASEETTPGPIAYWKFDENSGTQVKDSSGNNLTGTIHGTAWQGADKCVSGSCLYFNGTNTDYVEIADSPKFDIDGTAGFTYSVWMKGTSFSQAYNMMLGHFLPYFDVNNAGKLFAKVTIGGVQQTATGTTTLQTNQWYHVATTYKDGYIKLYVNGKLDSQAGPFAGVVNNQASSQYIGTWDSGHTYGFKGYLDEIKIYPYALTDEQFIQEYNLGFSTIVGQQDQGALSDGLVGYWKMDEASWNGTAGEVIDTSGNGNNGTATGGTSTGLGKYGNGGVFDGTDDYTQMSTTALPIGNTARTISLWIRPTTIAEFRSILYWGSATGNSMTGLDLSSSAIRFGFFSNDLNTPNGKITANVWNHVVATFDGSNRKIYVNGALAASDTTTTNTVSGNLSIGKRSTSFFPGSIDEIRVYNRALLPDEVSKLYGFAPGPIGHWKLDDGSGTAVVDSSGNSLNLSTVNTPTWAPGKFGGSMSFVAASSQYATIADNAILEPSSQLTLSAWIKRNSVGTRQIFMGKGNGNSDGTTQYWFEFDTSNRLVLYLSTGGVGANLVATDLTVTDTTSWHHVAAVWNGNITNIYLDGKKSSVAGAKTGSLTSCTYAFSIGKLGDFSGLHFNGLMDDVRVYNYARTTQQIMEDLNAGHPAGGSPVGSQLAYWKFDENGGQTTGDATGNYHATLGAATTASTDDPTWKTGSECKFNSCLSFDGGDHLKLGTIVDSSNSHTFTMWVKSSTAISGEKFIFDIATTRTVIGWHRTGGMLVYYDASGWRDSTINTPNDGTWHHLAYVLDSTSGSGSIYVDGVLRQSGIAYNPTAFNGAAAIGGRYDATAYWYTGYLDEFKIYSSALTTEQILIDMNQNQAMNYGAGGDAEAAIMTDGAGAPPVGEWKMDEGTGTVAKDTSGNGNDGTVSGATWKAGCQQGTCLEFDGVDDIVSVGNPVALQISTGTVEAWIKTTNPGSGFRAIIERQNGYGIFLKDNEFGLYDWGTAAFRGTGVSLNDGTWHHVAAVFQSGITNGTKLYIDGSEKLVTSMTVSSPTNVTIGAWNTGAQQFNGQIDHVRIYNYTRTPSQVAYDFNRGKPVVHWKMDECEGETIHDSSETGSHGTWNGAGGGTQTSVGTCNTAGTAWGNGATGKYGASLKFDGTDDYVESTTTLDSIPFTISGWIKYTGSLTTPGFVSFTGPSGHRRDVYIYNNSMIRIFTYDGTTPRYYVSSSIKSFNDNQWHHIVGTFDGTTPYVYADGVRYSVTTPVTAGTYPTGKIRIGALNISPMNSQYYFTGQIDEVGIYNYALSTDQVLQLTNEGFATRFGE